MLMSPLLISVLLSAMIGASGNDSHYKTVQVIELITVVAAVGAAVMLLVDMRLSDFWRPRDFPLIPEQAFDDYYYVPPHFLEPYPVLTISEAARYLGISDYDVWQVIDEGSIAATKIGSTFMVTRQALSDFERAEKEFSLNI
jgi:excisionase family DNA binding protein